MNCCKNSSSNIVDFDPLVVLHIMAWKYPIPDPVCPVCHESIRYRERTKCRKCGTWCHNTCVVYPQGKRGRRKGQDIREAALCFPCSGVIPNSVEPTPESIREIADLTSKEMEYTPNQAKIALIIYTSMFLTGPDEAKICELMNMDPKYVHTIGEQLRTNNIWTADGYVNAELGRHVGIEFTLLVLCAEGFLMRTHDNIVKPGLSQ